MRKVDRLMTEEVEISLLQMMANAGRGLATQARAMLGGDVRGRRIVVLAGGGGNGGGGMGAARQLSVRGAAVTVVLAPSRDDVHGVPERQITILERIGGPLRRVGDRTSHLFADADLLIDGLIGYSLRGSPWTCRPALTAIAASHRTRPYGLPQP